MEEAARCVRVGRRSSIWLWPWLVGLMALSYVSSFEGGKGYLHFGVDMAVTAVFSLAVYYFALHFRLSPEECKKIEAVGCRPRRESRCHFVFSNAYGFVVASV